MNKPKNRSLTIVTLGTKGNILERRPRYSNHSGVLLDSTILFDFGERKFLNSNPRAIFITHLHPDHACFMQEDFGTIGCPVYAPCAYKGRPEVRILNRPKKIGEFKITPIPTIHSSKTSSQGYLVEGKGKKIFYSGDIITIEKEHRKKLKHVDAVITDASYLRRGGMIHRFESGLAGHNGINELIRLFRPYTERIIFMHFGSWFVLNIKEGKKAIKALSDETLQTEVAYDGKEFLI